MEAQKVGTWGSLKGDETGGVTTKPDAELGRWICAVAKPFPAAARMAEDLLGSLYKSDCQDLRGEPNKVETLLRNVGGPPESAGWLNDLQPPSG